MTRAVRHHLLAALAAGVVMAGALTAAPPARAVSTAQIVSSAASTDCLDYQVVGICVWLTCTISGCYTETSVRVKHYLPDLVVSSYQRTGQNPWPAVAGYAQPTGDARMGGQQSRQRSHNDTSLRFKNADAIGDPAAAGFALLSSFGYSCDSEATAFEPYFLSTYDSLAWRQGIPESAYPEALIPGLRVIGQLGYNKWGKVYPRSGFTTQQNDYKAAAVVAERAADIVTRRGQPHVYIPLTGNTRAGYWPPGAVKEGDASTHKWQRLQPDPTKSCSVFPDRGPTASFAGDVAADGDYVWVLWRPYRCCQRRGETLIYYTPG